MEFLGVPKSEKPECTWVLEDFEDEGNEKITIKKRSHKKRDTSVPFYKLKADNYSAAGASASSAASSAGASASATGSATSSVATASPPFSAICLITRAKFAIGD